VVIEPASGQAAAGPRSEPRTLSRAADADRRWHRKADRAGWNRASLSRLIEVLAEDDPVFVLPEAVHAHTRHYMPQGRLAGGREDTRLGFVSAGGGRRGGGTRLAGMAGRP
jgi:hypothetical protein